MVQFSSKQEYFRLIANQFFTTPDIIEAITYGEDKVVNDRLRTEILSEFVAGSNQMFFALIWKGNPMPGGIRNLQAYRYVGQVMQGMNLFLHKTSYIAELFSVNSIIADAPYFRRLLSKRPNAGIVVIVAENADSLQTVCHEMARPYIFVNCPIGLNITDHYLISVKADNALRNVVSHLYELGHRRIGYIHGFLTHKAGMERLNKYYAGLDAVGLPVDQKLIAGGDWQETGGYQAAQELLALEDKPTAIIAANDRMALGAMQAARELGIHVPHDVSIVGFDNIAAAMQSTPSLSTVHQPLTKIGSTAAEIMSALLEGDTPEPRHHYLPVEFIIRDSISVPPSL